MLGVLFKNWKTKAEVQPVTSPDDYQIVQDSFAAAVERGRCFGVANQAGVTSQAGLSATTPVLTLYNPAGSGVNGRLWFAGAAIQVAAATVGSIVLAVGSDTIAAAVTGTLTTAHRNLKQAGISAQGNRLTPMLAATLPAAPVAVSLLGTMLTGAITTALTGPTLGRWFNGGLLISPGTNISIQTLVASGASGLLCEYIWEETDS